MYACSLSDLVRSRQARPVYDSQILELW
jgi:hypothetical protein